MVSQRNDVFAEESAEVEVLYANLGKLKTLTKKIQGSVARLDASGEVVKEAIGPIYSNTQQLQVTNRNIDRVNEAIEKLRQPIDAKGREEGVIRAGPRATGLSQYVGALKRVDRALADLTSSNLRSSQQAVSEFSSLLSSGSAQLQELFRQIVVDGTRPIEPLHYITKQLAFPTFSPEQSSNLNQIITAIASTTNLSSLNGQTSDHEAAQIYVEVRGPYLVNSLQNLGTASINTSKRRTADDSIYRAGTSGVGAYVTGIEGMFVAEKESISRIFPSDVDSVFQKTCRGAVDDFARTLIELNNVIQSHILSDCFLAFEITDLVIPLSKLLPSRTSQLSNHFSEALRPIQETARSTVGELLEQTRQRASATVVLPNDGNTVPFVPETMSRASSLAFYSRTLTSILCSIGDGKWRSSTINASSSSLALSLQSESEHPDILSHYLIDLIEALLSSLEVRAKAFYRTKSLQGCFLANSVCIVERSVHSSAELSRYIGVAPHSSKLDAWRKRGLSMYLEAWREPSSHLLDVVYTSRSGSARLSGGPQESAVIVKTLGSKDKDKIKEKFKAFNSSLDELVARHKSLYMETEVRSTLSREIQAMIEPLYVRFWDRYHAIDPKAKGKIVKYDKGALAGLMASLS